MDKGGGLSMPVLGSHVHIFHVALQRERKTPLTVLLSPDQWLSACDLKTMGLHQR